MSNETREERIERFVTEMRGDVKPTDLTENEFIDQSNDQRMCANCGLELETEHSVCPCWASDNLSLVYHNGEVKKTSKLAFNLREFVVK